MLKVGEIYFLRLIGCLNLEMEMEMGSGCKNQNLAAILGEKEADFGADEPGGTGDEDFHERELGQGVKIKNWRMGIKASEGGDLKAERPTSNIQRSTSKYPEKHSSFIISPTGVRVEWR